MLQLVQTMYAACKKAGESLTKQDVLDHKTPKDLEGRRKKLYQSMYFEPHLDALIDQGSVKYEGNGIISIPSH